MALAWATIAILVLLLPGFMFFTGFYAPSRFSRDTTPRSAVGQLAAIVLVSLVVHVALLWATRIGGTVVPWLPQIDLHLVLSSLQAGSTQSASLADVSRNLSEHLVAIPLYIGASVIAGFGIGYGIAKGAVRGPFSFLLEHAWIYELVPAGTGVATTYAYILSKVEHGGRIVLYKGPLHHVGLHQDGSFAYLVLRQAERFYLDLKADKPETTAAQALVIGATRTRGDAQQLSRSREIEFLYVEGDEIANVVFERFTFDTPETPAEAKAVIEKVVTENRPATSPRSRG